MKRRRLREEEKNKNGKVEERGKRRRTRTEKKKKGGRRQEQELKRRRTRRTGLLDGESLVSAETIKSFKSQLQQQGCPTLADIGYYYCIPPPSTFWARTQVGRDIIHFPVGWVWVVTLEKL